jgi:hypothetical protein
MLMMTGAEAEIFPMLPLPERKGAAEQQPSREAVDVIIDRIQSIRSPWDTCDQRSPFPIPRRP